jgi:hypothetical protein
MRGQESPVAAGIRAVVKRGSDTVQLLSEVSLGQGRHPSSSGYRVVTWAGNTGR